MQKIFEDLRKQSREICNCGHKGLAAGIWHKKSCPYFPIFMMAFRNEDVELIDKEGTHENNVPV